MVMLRAAPWLVGLAVMFSGCSARIETHGVTEIVMPKVGDVNVSNEGQGDAHAWLNFTSPSETLLSVELTVPQGDTHDREVIIRDDAVHVLTVKVVYPHIGPTEEGEGSIEIDPAVCPRASAVTIDVGFRGGSGQVIKDAPPLAYLRSDCSAWND